MFYCWSFEITRTMLKKVQSQSDILISSMIGFLVGVGDCNTVVGVGAGDRLVAGSASVIPMSIPITRLSRPLAVGVVDVVAVGPVVVGTALVDERVAAAIAISRLSRPLAISVASIASIAIAGQTLGASVDRAGATMRMVGNSSAIAVSRLSLSVPLAVVAAVSIATISIASIVSRKSLGRSVGVASGITIPRLGLSVPLAIAVDVVPIVVVGRAVAIAMVSLRHIH